MAKNRLGDEVPPRSTDYNKWKKKAKATQNDFVPISRWGLDRQDPIFQFRLRLRYLMEYQARAELGYDEDSVEEYDRYRAQCEDWAWNTCDASWDTLVKDYDGV